MVSLESGKISERCWKASQSWFYELLTSVSNSIIAGRSIRVSIRRNAYDEQSHAKVQLWDGDKWQLICSLHISECKCKEISYTDKDVKAAQFHEDAKKLLRIAQQITCG